MRVGIEVGGTFTDLVMSDGKNIKTAKVPSTPASPDEGAMLAIKAAGLKLDEISELIHGSTVATNAVLERKGGRVCFFVTQGTKDLLLIQRHDRRAIYDLQYQKPSPVVPRHHTYEINERIAADGKIGIGTDVSGTSEGYFTASILDAQASILLKGTAQGRLALTDEGATSGSKTYDLVSVEDNFKIRRIF